MYAVVVTFRILPDSWEAFLPLIRQNANCSVRDEPDCHQFDVWTDPEHPFEVFLYETYTHRAGFEAHLATEHFKAFDTLVAPMIAGKTVRFFAELQP